MREGYRNPMNDPYSSTYNPGWRMISSICVMFCISILSLFCMFSLSFCIYCVDFCIVCDIKVYTSLVCIFRCSKAIMGHSGMNSGGAGTSRRTESQATEKEIKRTMSRPNVGSTKGSIEPMLKQLANTEHGRGRRRLKQRRQTSSRRRLRGRCRGRRTPISAQLRFSPSRRHLQRASSRCPIRRVDSISQVGSTSMCRGRRRVDELVTLLKRCVSMRWVPFVFKGRSRASFLIVLAKALSTLSYILPNLRFRLDQALTFGRLQFELGLMLLVNSI